MITRRTCLLSAISACALLASCASSQKSASTPVNRYCPMMPQDKLDPTVTVNYKGQTVAFCCEGCIPEWQSLSDTERDARLVRAR